MDPSLSRLSIDVRAPNVAIGWIVATECNVGPSPPELLEIVQRTVRAARRDAESDQTQKRKADVRNMLRVGKYKPTGRGKPASEYLLRAACNEDFPLINNVVEINNIVSLESLLPISLLDLERCETDSFVIRQGEQNEEYVFNPSGQVLSLRDLLLVARLPSDEPCGTPVKDSQATKTDDSTRNVLGVIFGPASYSGHVGRAAGRMEELLRGFAAGQARSGVVTGPAQSRS